MFTQRLILPVRWGSQGYRRTGAPDSSVTIEIPDHGPNAVKLPQGQATVALGGALLGTAPVNAIYPGQSVVLELLKNEALEAEVLVDSVGRQYSMAGSGGKISITSNVRANIIVTLKAPGINADAPACDFQVILPDVPSGAVVTGDINGCRFLYDVDKQAIEINQSIAGRQEIAVPFTIVYNERSSEYQLDSENSQVQFLRLVVENKAAFEPDFIARVNVLEQALAEKTVAANKLAELRKTIDRLEQERRSVIDSLVKIGQSNSPVSQSRDQRKCDELTTELDRLDEWVNSFDRAARAAQEAL
jgi:hypothetical protein